MFVDVIGHPIDTMKTRMQASTTARMPFRSIIGPNWKSLFVGMSTNIAAWPAGFSYFAVYELFKGFSEDKFKDSSYVFFGHLLAGTLGEISSIIVR